MIRRHLLQITIITVFLLITGCASSGKSGGGFPFFGKKSEASPPPTMIQQPMMSPQVMPGQEIHVQPTGAGPNAPPSYESIGQPYTPPVSQSSTSTSSPYQSYSSPASPSSYSPSSSSSTSTYGSGSSSSTPSPSSTYPSSSSSSTYPSSNSSSGSGYGNPSSSSGGYGYPSGSGSSGSSGSSSNGYYGPSTSIQAPVNKHYASRVQTYSPTSVSNLSGYNQNNPHYQSPMVDYQSEIPVTQVTARTADQHTQLKGGMLSVHASSTPEFLIQNGIYTRVGHGQVTVLPQRASYESQADELPPMSGEMTKNRETLVANSNPDSKWDDSDRYESPSMWEAMASQNINVLLGNGQSSRLVDEMHHYATPLTAQDYQLAVVRGQTPKKEESPVLMTRASAIISGSIY